MAASVRIRVVDVFLDNNPLNKFIDPFWSHILLEKYPYIHNVQSKILSMCEQIAGASNQSHMDVKNFRASSLVKNESCLWLDECLLPHNEPACILRDGDSLILKLKSKNILDGGECTNVADGLIAEETKLNHSAKKKKKKPKCLDDDVCAQENSFVEETSNLCESSQKEKRKRKREKNASYHEQSDSNGVKILDEHSPKNGVKFSSSPVFNFNYEDPHLKMYSMPTPVKCSEFEEKKRKLLSDLEQFEVEGLEKAQNNTEDVSMDTSLNKDIESFVEDCTPKKKRRRKRKGKIQKRNESVTEPVKVEDKPRVSHLKLPWDKRPQNSKITFDSDDDGDDCRTVVIENVKSEVFNQTDPDPILQKPQQQSSPGDKLKTSVIEQIERNIDRNLDAIKQQLNLSSSSNKTNIDPNKPSDGNNKSRKFPSRKLLMRSTGGILNLIRDSESSGEVVDVKDSGDDDSPILQPKLQNINTHTRTSFAIPQDQHNNPPVGLNSQAANSLDKSVSDSSEKNITSPLATDVDEKFNELLQRRKLSNNLCTVVTSQNGVTVCSRNRNKINKPFADPAHDVLTNISTIRHAPQESSTKAAGKLESEKVEVIPLDVASCSPLKGEPCVGDIIGYKTLEMDEQYCPVVSDFKTGKVVSFDNGVISLRIFGNTAPKRQLGKFDLVYPEETETSGCETDLDFVSMELSSMFDTRLIQRE